ncbi:serine hydrolase [Enterococcus saccharolyticus]|uniref:serine hydrolase n=1 Tax=Enterococcus saccharolyticus TaxID=41997 RepID=UPI0039E12E5E
MKKKHRFLPLLAGILFFLSSVVPLFSVQADELSGDFKVEAKAALSIDADTGKILYDQNSDDALGIASITKIISLYLVEKEVAEGKLAWDDEVEISDFVAELSVHPELSNVPLESTSKYTVKDLFDSAFIQSSNASTMALAEKIAGTEAAFVDLMKKQLEDWGIKDAKIVNSTGLNNVYLGEQIYPGSKKDDENILSAKGVAIVARHLIHDYPDVLEVTATPKQEFGAHTFSPIEMVNWNWMLPGMLYEKAGVDGLKTGTTDLAGACFVGTMTKDGQRIITVVLNATNHETDPGARFVETGRLMDYTFDNWKKEEVLAQGATVPEFKTAPVHQGKELTVPVQTENAVTVWLHSSMTKEDVTFKTTLNAKRVTDKNELQAPIEKGENVGTVQATTPDKLGFVEASDEESVQTPLVASQEMAKANIFVQAWRAVKGLFN